MQPLSNVRVIDLTHVIAGPFCTFQLAVMGADVIKIEPPQRPDMSRMDGGDPDDCKRGMGSMYQTQSANKRAVAIDIKSESGRNVLLQLVKSADVLVENYRPGALESLGLGYDDVSAIKPDIIYCSLTGFGQHGPLANRTAYDNVIQAMSGLMATTGDVQSAPMKVGPPVLDYGTGIQGAFAIVSALYQRTHTGEGQRIDLAMLDAAIMLSGTSFTHLHTNGNEPVPSGNSSTYNAGYGCYDTREGLLVIGAWTADQLADMWLVLGDPSISQRVRSERPWEYALHYESDAARLSEIALTESADEWEKRFNAAKVPAARVRGVRETASHPQLDQRGVFQNIDVDGINTRIPTAAFTYASNGPCLHSAPPRHGQHTLEVLTEAGISAGQLETLTQKGVIKIV